jgi:hypothetical protein
MRDWTGVEIKELKRLYQKFDITGCAYILNRTYDSVRLKAIELKLVSPFNPLGRGKVRQFYAEDVANMFELRCMGFGPTEIAKCFQSKVRTITVTMSKAKKLGFDRFPKRVTI